MNNGMKFPGFLIAIIFIWSCSTQSMDDFYNKNGSLAPCPESPNCVSTRNHDSRHAMSPLPYMGTKEQSRLRIIQILNSMNRSQIVDVSDHAIHASFKSRLFRFVDDVVFHFDDAGSLIHYRSASRVGYYDFGVNRRRMMEISKRYLTK